MRHYSGSQNFHLAIQAKDKHALSPSKRSQVLLCQLPLLKRSFIIMSKLFYFVLAMDAIVPIIAIFYFFMGLSDGTVSPRNILMWVVLLAALIILWLACLYLYKAGWMKIAWVIALLQTLPVAIGVTYLATFILGSHRWN